MGAWYVPQHTPRSQVYVVRVCLGIIKFAPGSHGAGTICICLHVLQTVPERLCLRWLLWSGAVLSSQCLGLMLNRYPISSNV